MLSPEYLLAPLGSRGRAAITAALDNIRQAGGLPHPYVDSINDVAVLIDYQLSGGDLMGAACWWSPGQIRVSPSVAHGLCGPWWSTRNMSTTAKGMACVVTELTNLATIRGWCGLAWPVLSLPIVRCFTVQEWAAANRRVAMDILERA